MAQIATGFWVREDGGNKDLILDEGFIGDVTAMSAGFNGVVLGHELGVGEEELVAEKGVLQPRSAGLRSFIPKGYSKRNQPPQHLRIL